MFFYPLELLEILKVKIQADINDKVTDLFDSSIPYQ